ncbi:MAG: FtsW/RodA/SpoVE family cell cycle protein [Kiritimatiellia bacterium]
MKRDWLLLGAVLALAVFGLLFQVRLARAVADGGGVAMLFAGCAVAGAAALVCGKDRMEALLARRGALVAAGIACALLLALLVFGRRYRGGLYLPGRVNPSEFVKLCVIAFTAGFWARQPPARDLVLWAGGMGAVAGLVVLAGDFGLLAQLALTVAAMLFAASWFWGLAATATLAAGIACVSFRPAGHLATRLAVWENPLADATGAGWQTLQGLTAIVAGGWTGSGFGLGDVQRVPIVSSDFIYAAVAEDLGLAGGIAVLGVWTFAWLRGLAVAVRADARGARVGALLATGIVASLAVQTILNVAGVLNALPMTGITLPLISHGGSSLLATCAMCGVLFGLSGPGGRGKPGARPGPDGEPCG